MRESINPEHYIKIGTVLRLNVRDTNPPKIKRFIIVGISSDKNSVATVFINSEINPNINWSLEQQDYKLNLNQMAGITLIKGPTLIVQNLNSETQETLQQQYNPDPMLLSGNYQCRI